MQRAVSKKKGDEMMKRYEVYVLAIAGETIGRPTYLTEHKILDECKDRMRYMVPGESLIVKQVG